MLKPFLIVGVGGSGGKTLRSLRKVLRTRLDQVGWQGDFPQCWQLIHVDTPLKQEDGPFPVLPDNDYLGLVTDNLLYTDIYDQVFTKAGLKNHLHDLEKVMPDPNSVPANIRDGAGRYRGIGRQIALSNLDRIGTRIETAIKQINSAGGTLKELSTAFGVKNITGAYPPPQIIVITSMAGGSGAGQFIEVTEAIKSAINPKSLEAGEIFSIIYSPDIFNDLSLNNSDPSFSANTMLSMAEMLSGLWSGGPDEAERALYTSRGISLTDSTDPRATLGPAFNYIVGKENGAGVNFKNQIETYSAVSHSIAKWVVDAQVQSELTQYAVANWHATATSITNTPDSTRLKDENSQAPAFSSFGFGRVSLGMDYFKDYASERLARSTIDQLLFKHTETDREFKEKDDWGWIQSNAERAFNDFITDLNLYEEDFSSGENNQVIDALRPLDEFYNQRVLFVNQITDYASEGVDPKSGTKAISDWQDSIILAYGQFETSYAEKIKVARHEKIRLWCDSIQTDVLAGVARYSAMYGVPVTVNLLKLLQESLLRASQQLENQGKSMQAYAANYRTNIASALNNISPTSQVRIDHPDVMEAIQTNCDSNLYSVIEAELLIEVSQLLLDFLKNYVDPLTQSLKIGYEDLKSNIQSTKESENQGFNTWPEMDSPNVPPKFYPPENEKVLINVDEYPEILKRELQATNKIKEGEALVNSVQEIVIGSLAGEVVGQTTPLDGIVQIDRKWTPVEQWARNNRSLPPTKAVFKFQSKPAVFVERVNEWTKRKGLSINSFINQTLKVYLNPSGDEYQTRLSKFELAFTEAFTRSAPLVSLDPGLLLSVHDRNTKDHNVLVSTIPFAQGSEEFKIVSKVINAGYPGMDVFKSEWFDSSSDSSNIEIFTQLRTPVQPIVMTSLMKPLWDAWSAASVSKDGRLDFIKWRIARSILATIPTSQKKKMSLMRGWHTARILGQIESIAGMRENNSSTQQEASIWTPGDAKIQIGFVPFPTPLLAGKVVGTDLLGPILRSMIVALAECGEKKSIAPLHPYHRLLDLDPVDNNSSDLFEWVRNGKLPKGAPSPLAERAGTSSDSMQQRKQAIVLHLNSEIEKHDLKISEIESGGLAIRNRPLVWEMRKAYKQTLSDIANLVQTIEDEESGA